MKTHFDPQNNITYINGLCNDYYSLPTSKFVYSNEQNYRSTFRSRNIANNIRRESYATMNLFDPTYYLKMKQFQYVKQKSQMKPGQTDSSLNLRKCFAETNDLQCPKHPIYMTSRKYGVPSLDWLFDNHDDDPESKLKSTQLIHVKEKKPKKKNQKSQKVKKHNKRRKT